MDSFVRMNSVFPKPQTGPLGCFLGVRRSERIEAEHEVRVCVPAASPTLGALTGGGRREEDVKDVCIALDRRLKKPPWMLPKEHLTPSSERLIDNFYQMWKLS